MSRLQLALNVDDLETSIAFYSTLFGTEPHKVRPGYANFAVAEPPLKLVLIENAGHGGSINHLGVEVADIDSVDAELTRLGAAGFAADRGARHHVLLCQAGQVLGPGHAGRRALGGLHDHRRPARGTGRGRQRRGAGLLHLSRRAGVCVPRHTARDSPEHHESR